MQYRRRHGLSSIPEHNETEEETKTDKWVPKQKHEVLKAKYKCLKKLFQIYDASVIGILPEPYEQGDGYLPPEEEADPQPQHQHRSRRRKRSHRTKADASAGTTNDLASGDGSVTSEDKESLASAAVHALKPARSCSTQATPERQEGSRESVEYQPSSPSRAAQPDPEPEPEPETRLTEPVHYAPATHPHSAPYIMYREQRKPSRFQLFLQRLFGMRREGGGYSGAGAGGRMHAASDNNITYNYCEKRRRRGLRFRRVRRAKKVRSELMLRDVSSPAVLSFVQSVQRTCLQDRTPRPCPFIDCNNVFYGIINYNDHLNVVHFLERKFPCVYCHEGFASARAKSEHERAHVGGARASSAPLQLQYLPANPSLKHSHKTSDTQTEPQEAKCEVQEEKLKKIVSFFDKMADPEQILEEMSSDHGSTTNLPDSETGSSASGHHSATTRGSDKRSASGSCTSVVGRVARSVRSLVETRPSHLATPSKCAFLPVQCRLCGEDFDYRRQLSLHVGLEHGSSERARPSKFHSCAGVIHSAPHAHTHAQAHAHEHSTDSERVQLEAGRINIQSSRGVAHSSTSTALSPTHTPLMASRRNSGTLSCDPSTNIIYYSSMESIRKPSLVNSFVQRVRHGVTSYHWEPGTKIIRV